ncbi:MAG TPA: nuclear transport factor 2 family protein [Candidatus Acidoferrales bacterium]|nr:nuclear transport factor 2 family protein [Candidatus Acidoferrales bacterium]
MRIRWNVLAVAYTGLLWLLTSPSPAAQTEIPIQKCDRLPVVILQVDKVDKRFLVDTAATSFLNANSFSGRHTREVRIRSWNGTTALNAGDISLAEVTLGAHTIHNVELPAIDLSAISQACGGQLDGILGVDLLEQLGVTIDLERSVARLNVVPGDSERGLIADMTKAIGSCSTAFNNAELEKFASCFDPEFVLSSPGGELHGRDQVANYFRQYFEMNPRAHLWVTMNTQHGVGDLVWGLYDYTIEAPSRQTSGRGMILCRKSDNHWYIVSMHQSEVAATVIPKP